MAIRDEIAQQALNLPLEDRAYIADVIEQSLSAAGFASSEIAAAWSAEIERRAQAYERGEMPAQDWRAVIARLRESHSRRSA